MSDQDLAKTRLEAFEAMLGAVQREYADILSKMDKMKGEGKVKTVTYQQLLGTMDAMEMILMTSDYWGVVHGADPGEAARDEEGMAVAARLGRNMAWMVKVLHETKLPAPEAAQRPMMNFIR